MPIYEYHCATCQARVEVLVRSYATTPACPNCGSPLTDKLFSAPHLLSGESRRPAGHTCCGRDERCDAPPCSGGSACRRD
ncbi:MAG: zinc ribbon domain-containing protein [Anaerolineae bacterium]|nr:zinc ribbon domain-containing protein [Anaerolineae bacterium]